ncbi:YlaI family protein [Alteribacter aurantiacus]|uniref:YlaI family protein n=1 Tax=Alteribacter aurantiacus TaxID=254410 RepID=UPI00047D898E|nr:YlaI family protein [Alteribacter aurantiacus]
MRVQCVMCNVVEDINDYSPLAKKLRNRPIHTYMCDECYGRIEKRTNERKATGNFKTYEEKKDEDEWLI